MEQLYIVQSVVSSLKLMQCLKACREDFHWIIIQGTPFLKNNHVQPEVCTGLPVGLWLVVKLLNFHTCVHVTVYEKSVMWDFSRLVIFNNVNSTTLELTLLQVWDRSRVLFTRYEVFCAMTRKLLNSRKYGPNALLCARMRFPYTTSASSSFVGGPDDRLSI